jgi:hypothetical protein
VRSTAPSDRVSLFGLLNPELGETEIFEPICQGIARAPELSQVCPSVGQHGGGRCLLLSHWVTTLRKMCESPESMNVEYASLLPVPLTTIHQPAARSVKLQWLPCWSVPHGRTYPRERFFWAAR